jgi:hypothetical protein
MIGDMIPGDTTPEAYIVQMRAFARLSSQTKAAMSCDSASQSSKRGFASAIRITMSGKFSSQRFGVCWASSCFARSIRTLRSRPEPAKTD